MSSIDRATVGALAAREASRFADTHQGSAARHAEAGASLLGGVPMAWMRRWPGGFPVYVEHAGGACFTDVDGNEYVDFCLGDTGAMTGHVPPAALAAITRQLTRGITTMLPTEDAAVVGAELARRFGVRSWQFTLSATDANRFVLRLARHVTGRRIVVVFDGCYHGTVDESVVTVRDGRTVPRPGSVGPPVDPGLTTRAVSFNDVDSLASALAPGDVACVLAEPAMTNAGIILPVPGYHDALRRLTHDTGTLLVLDETHTWCAGPGGATAAWGLQPDAVTLGKPLGSGIPCGAYGVSAALADRVEAITDIALVDVGGIGGTLAGNALSLAAMRSTLEDVLTGEAFAHMLELGERFTAGVEETIAALGVPWHVTRLGARAEYRFHPDRPRDGAAALASDDPDLDSLAHLYMLNRGILLTPFHNMALMSPATAPGDVDRHTTVFGEMVAELT